MPVLSPQRSSASTLSGSYRSTMSSSANRPYYNSTSFSPRFSTNYSERYTSRSYTDSDGRRIYSRSGSITEDGVTTRFREESREASARRDSLSRDSGISSLRGGELDYPSSRSTRDNSITRDSSSGSGSRLSTTNMLDSVAELRNKYSPANYVPACKRMSKNENISRSKSINDIGLPPIVEPTSKSSSLMATSKKFNNQVIMINNDGLNYNNSIGVLNTSNNTNNDNTNDDNGNRTSVADLRRKFDEKSSTILCNNKIGTAKQPPPIDVHFESATTTTSTTTTIPTINIKISENLFKKQDQESTTTTTTSTTTTATTTTSHNGLLKNGISRNRAASRTSSSSPLTSGSGTTTTTTTTTTTRQSTPPTTTTIKNLITNGETNDIINNKKSNNRLSKSSVDQSSTELSIESKLSNKNQENITTKLDVNDIRNGTANIDNTPPPPPLPPPTTTNDCHKLNNDIITNDNNIVNGIDDIINKAEINVNRTSSRINNFASYIPIKDFETGDDVSPPPSTSSCNNTIEANGELIEDEIGSNKPPQQEIVINGRRFNNDLGSSPKLNTNAARSGGSLISTNSLLGASSNASPVSSNLSRRSTDRGNNSYNNIEESGGLNTTATGYERGASNNLATPSINQLGLNGLKNIGNTCFMNSVIQCLSNTRSVLEYLLKDRYISDINTTNSAMKGALIKAFAEVIKELWSEDSIDRVVNTTSLKSQIQRFAPRFIGYAQQDAQEFLRYLLEGLHEDVNRVTEKPKPILVEISDKLSDNEKSSESWQRYLRMDNSKIVDCFVGQLKSTLKCTHCGHCSVTFDPFWDLSLPIPQRAGQVRLSQCLDSFTREETLDGDEKPTCSKCKERRKCTKSFSIQKFPKILVIHLKRFSLAERFRGKLSVTVDFPLEGLDMSNYAADSVSACRYNLYAVSNHSGTTYSGHYTAYCRHPYSKAWHEYNDSRVSTISSKSIVSGEAYVLFYEQEGQKSHL